MLSHMKFWSVFLSAAVLNGKLYAMTAEECSIALHQNDVAIESLYAEIATNEGSFGYNHLSKDNHMAVYDWRGKQLNWISTNTYWGETDCTIPSKFDIYVSLRPIVLKQITHLSAAPGHQLYCEEIAHKHFTPLNFCCLVEKPRTKMFPTVPNLLGLRSALRVYPFMAENSQF